jgi:hypothetical protein
MSDARIKGGRQKGRLGWSGGDDQRRRRIFTEHWLERELQGLYQSSLEESVPEDMLDIVKRLAVSEPPGEQTKGPDETRTAGQNRRILRKNVRTLHRLLNFKAEASTEEKIVTLLAEPQRRKPPGPTTSRTKSNPEARSPDAQDRAGKLRAKAEECRTAAESMNSEAARRTFLNLARNYEALADRAVRDQRSRKKPEAG